MGFWDLVITKKCHMVCLDEFWQFSDSCVFHYLASLKAGQKLLDHAGNLVLFDSARKIVISAVRRLEDYGFNVRNLHEALTELKSFSSLG
jgi:hypothetical protein